MKDRDHTLLMIVTIVMTLIIVFVAFTPRAMAEENLSSVNGKNIYMHYCTPCHGVKGDGKGFNAINLDPRPTNHTDASLMSKRTDKDLYDVINDGGRAVGKSSLMPPWGNTLKEIQIEELILYLRKLCKCKEG